MYWMTGRRPSGLLVCLFGTFLAASLAKAQSRYRPPLECERIDFGAIGLACNERSPCPLSLELTATAGAGPVVVVAGQIRSPELTIASIALRSADGGRTWQEPVERTLAAGFEQVVFADPTHLLLGGMEGEPPSAEPLLFVSEDGGLTWERRRFFDEDSRRGGAVIALIFDDVRHGFAVVERLSSVGDPFETYETRDGGRSWSIVSISAERPTLPAERNPAPVAWRLVDSDEGFTLERLEQQQWTPQAEFPSDLGECR